MKSHGKQVVKKHTYVWLLFLQIWAKISAQCNLWELTKITYHKVVLNVYKIRKVLWRIFGTEKHKKIRRKKKNLLFLQSVDAKGCLILEGALILVPLPTKGAKWAENLNFLPITVNNLFKFSAQGSNLAPFIGNGTKVQIPSEIKPPFLKQKNLLTCLWHTSATHLFG